MSENKRPRKEIKSFNIPQIIIMERKEDNQGKIKIGVGFFVAAKAGETEKTREVEIRNIIKELAEFFQASK